MSETSTPSLADVLRGTISDELSGVHVAIPGRVTAYSASRARASVQPLIRRGYTDEAGERQSERLPVVVDVPVVFPGSGPYSLKFPIGVGDTVLLVFASASLDKWLAIGGEVDPVDDRRHSLSDAIAIPGLRARPHSADPAHAIEFTATEIRVGGNSGLVTRDEFNSHTHTVATTGSSSSQSGTAAAPSPVAGTQVLKGA